MLLVIDTVDKTIASVSEVGSLGESLAAMLLNYDDEDSHNYDEVVATLSGLGSYSKNPLKLDINFKYWETPPAKLSIDETSKLELKILPPHIRYAFLGGNNILP